MPLYENVRLQFIQKYIFYLKSGYILVCSNILIKADRNWSMTDNVLNKYKARSVIYT